MKVSVVLLMIFSLIACSKKSDKPDNDNTDNNLQKLSDIKYVYVQHLVDDIPHGFEPVLTNSKSYRYDKDNQGSYVVRLADTTTTPYTNMVEPNAPIGNGIYDVYAKAGTVIEVLKKTSGGLTKVKEFTMKEGTDFRLMSNFVHDTNDIKRVLFAMLKNADKYTYSEYIN